ncbi:hypothetical protein [Bacillus infantis]|uniref:DUF5050 domain-containing protein n=1 Tax=Bacillus infantis TaxID=324767 RepID=A0A5D4RK08_9BACI|nr:hypothetical protein [Bacillus infantis]TYS51139.1 hypothetical protein FZD51_03600 [Bacillus infantis]
MKKKLTLMVGIFAGLLLLTGLYFLFINDSGKASENDLDKVDFLKDKKAAVYLSTTADQDTYGGGKSIAVFINKKGAPVSFEMEGLELGSIGIKENEVLLEDKKNFYKIAEGFEKIQREDYQHTGDHIGILENRNSFYALFNSGYDKEAGGYRSDYYWEENGEFEKGTIPFFIEASVIYRDSLYTLSSSENDESYVLSEVKLKKDTPMKTIVEIGKKENSTTFGQLQADEKSIYFIRQTRNITEMVTVDKKSGEHFSAEVATYSNDDETLYQQTPFSFKRCFFLYNEHLYFADGFGDVYRIPKEGGEGTKVFSLPAKSLEGSLEVFQQNGHLYLFTLNHKNNSAKIEQYTLSNGKKSGELKINDFPNMNNINTKMYLYDFVMLEDLE